MKIDRINTNNINKPIFKGYLTRPVAYPEFYESYIISEKIANDTDSVKSNPLTAFWNKVASAYRLIFKPDINKTGEDIQRGIDTVFELEKEGKNLNRIA